MSTLREEIIERFFIECQENVLGEYLIDNKWYITINGCDTLQDILDYVDRKKEIQMAREFKQILIRDTYLYIAEDEIAIVKEYSVLPDQLWDDGSIRHPGSPAGLRITLNNGDEISIDHLKVEQLSRCPKVTL